MSKQWQEYSDNYVKLTTREQYLIFITGLIAITFIAFYLFIGPKITENNKSAEQIMRLQSSNQTLKISTLEMQAALQRDPNEDTKNKIAQYEAKLAKIDEKLLTLTSDLISPVQMRYALLDLLKLEKGVSLLSFELLGAQPLLSNELEESAPSNSTRSEGNQPKEIAAIEGVESLVGLNLYRHGIKIKLTGSYFDLQNYLSQLEKLSWKFFWQDFNFKLTEYPKNELEIEMYSLGTKKEFVGV
jgi:MSHA biogenesis protein MshJ